MYNGKLERVIFRSEYDPFMRMTKYLAVFPDDAAQPGNYCYVPLWFRDGEDGATFEALGEMSAAYYYYNTAPIHVRSPLAKRLHQAVEKYYGESFALRERMN